MRVVPVDGSFEHWRGIARDLLARGVPPEEVSFSVEGQIGLLPALAPGGAGTEAAGGALRVPAEFLALARRAACHRDPSRWDRLYRILWRAARDGGRTFQDVSDPDVLGLERMADAVRRDVERVHALVRFRRIAVSAGEGAGEDELYLAFHRPEHHTLRLAAPFFARRFAPMRWSLLTPELSAHWDRRVLSFGPGVPQDPGSSDDAESLWRAYYATTFNPARVNERLLRAHLPRRHWDTLPEAREIAELVRGARPRTGTVPAVLRAPRRSPPRS